MVEIAGSDAEKYMFICLFESIDFKDPKIQNGSKDQAKTQFLIQHLTSCSSQTNFLDYFAQVRIPYVNLFSKCKGDRKDLPKAKLSGVYLRYCQVFEISLIYPNHYCHFPLPITQQTDF